jgi:RND superfamily putative drug exporter
LLPIAWIAAAILVTLYLPTVTSNESSGGDLTPPDTPALLAEAHSFEVFGTTALSRTIVVQRDEGGLPDDVREAAFVQAAGVLRGETGAEFPGLVAALPVLNLQPLVPGSKEDGTTIITYLYFDPTVGWGQQRDVARAYGQALAQRPGASVVGVTGVIPARLAQGEAIVDRLPWIELTTVLVIAFIVGVTFRSIGAPLITLAAGIIAFLISGPVVMWVGERAGFSSPPELRPLMVVLLLGIVTDYAIFFLSGFRHALTAGFGRWRAARHTLTEYGPIILTAGLMVAAGTAVLLVASLRFFRAFGPGLALTVLIGLLVALTLVPALLALAGPFAFWPGGLRRKAPAQVAPRRGDDEGKPADERIGSRRAPDETAAVAGWSRRGLRTRFAHFMTKRSVAALLVLGCVAALLIASLPLRGAALGFDVITGLPKGSEPKLAAEAAAQGFAVGILSPTEVLLEGDGLGERRVELVALQEAIAGLQGVSAVIGPREQPEELQEQIQAEAEAQTEPEAQALTSGDPAIVVSEDGRAARYLVVFDADPLGSGGIEHYERLDEALPELAARAGLEGVEISFAGDTAVTGQTIDRTVDDLQRVAIAVVIVDLFLLIIFLRALVAPVYLLLASVLSLTASAGVTVLIFQRLFDVQDLTYFVPFAAAVLLISLGSDYNLLLVGKIWEEARLRELRPAIEVAIPRATRAISVAAIALAASFALLAIVPLTAFRQLAMLLSVGILIDSFVVRSLLVPALVALFGRSSAWPGWLWRRRKREAVAEAPVVEGSAESSA